MTEGLYTRFATLTVLAERHPVAADALLVVLLSIATAPDALRRGEATALTLSFHVALWLPIVFRRRAPIVVYGVVCAIAFVQWLSRVEVVADLAVLVGLYTVAAHRNRAEALLATAVLEVGVFMAALRWGQEAGTVRSVAQLTALVAAAVLLGRSVQTRQAGFAALRDRAERLELERDQQAQIAAAAERTRIAREMHDIVAHSLSVMITLADGAALTDRADDARTAMRQVSRTGRDALADTRRVLGVLRDQSAPVDLHPQPELATLESLLTAVRATGLRVEMEVGGESFAPTPTAQAAIYRLVQEALTNTVKHAAGATKAMIVLSYDRPDLGIAITDDGSVAVGRSLGPNRGGHGLTGMRERAALFGGVVEAGPVPSGGWRVATTLHLDGFASGSSR